MRKVLLLLSILVCFCTSGYSQIIKGTIIDRQTKNPIYNALVYFNGTSVGTYADKNGYFELDNSKNILMPLTISSLGYNSETILVFPTEKPILIQLTPQVFELKEVFITEKGNPEARKANLYLFKRKFLGATPNAMTCEITNENDITLIFNSKDETLRAFSSKPIIINNKALGYKIFYYLNKFEFCKRNNKLFLLGNYFFKEEPVLNKIRQRRFEKRREAAYLGSRMHFFRSLWENNLDSSGFEVKDTAKIRLSYDKLVVQKDSLSTRKKYLKYLGKLYLTYDKENVVSSILMTKEYVYFDKTGFFDPTGIQWDGQMATQLIADLLPFEYSLSKEESIQLIPTIKQYPVKHDFLVPDRLSGKNHPVISMEEYIQMNEEYPHEKIFLHLDRNTFIQGDTVWFKAYSWYGYDQIPDTLSRLMYVDLINPTGEVVLKRKLLIQNGTSIGDFYLDTILKPDRYMLRAYTRWMQNINTGEPFYQAITISPSKQNFQIECTPVILKQAKNDSLKISFRFFEIDPKGDLNNSYNHNVNYSFKIGDLLQTSNILTENNKEQVFKYSLAGINPNDSLAEFEISIRDSRLTFNKLFQIPLRENVDIQFLPEGGNLVNGIVSKVAFKCVGTDGLSREVNGEIRDGGENIITVFKSSGKGMGTFWLRPEEKKWYFAHLLYNKQKYIIPLPDALKKGCVVSVGILEKDNERLISLKQSPSGTTSQKYVIGSAHGKTWFSVIVKMTKDSCRLRVPVELLPEGVCILTVLNENFKPECERLIYNDKGERFKFEIKTDSSSYRTRSKVTLLIKTTGPDESPVQTDLSLAVVDKQIAGETQSGGICAYKLLESELNGYIEDANFYFNNDSCGHMGELDLLLMTQGYRKFISDNTNPDKLKFQPEKKIEVTGKIKFDGSKLRVKKFNYRDINLMLMCWSDGMYLDQCNPDSLGWFKFQTPLLPGKSKSVLQATTTKGKPFYGEITLDESANPLQFNPLIFSENRITLPAVEYIHQLQAIKKTDVSKISGYGEMSVTLGEVKVTAKAKNWYSNFKPEAKKIANLDSLDPSGDKYENIYYLLIREFDARSFNTFNGIKTILLPSICMSKGFNYWYPIYIINGKTYFNGSEDAEMCIALLSNLSSLRVNEIKRIMVLPPGNSVGSYYAGDLFFKAGVTQSLVVIETYSDNTYRGDPQGIKTFILDGLDSPRLFYSPRYDGQLRKSPIYDGRTTLFWNPSIKTDVNGEAKAEFFTSDRQTNLEVIVNGIELGNGNPGQGRTLISSGLKNSPLNITVPSLSGTFHKQ